MVRKLKIIAKIAKNTEQEAAVTLPSHQTEYQWRWARVLTVLLTFVVLPVSAVIYFYPSDITALENKQSAFPAFDTEQERLQLNSQSQPVATADLAIPEPGLKAVIDDTKPQVPQEPQELNEDVSSSASEIEPLPEKLSETEVVEQNETEVVDVSEQPTESVTQTPNTSKEKDEVSTLSDTTMGMKIDTQHVSRALLTRDIKAREPIDIINERIARSSFTKKLFFFTEVRGLNNQTVHHKWYFDEKLQADVALSIYSNRYRTYSSKNISALQQGLWRVELVVNEKILASKQFTVTGQ